MAGLRVMYWPNEPAHLYPGFVQAGGRAAFEAMAADGTIAALRIYSQRVERAGFADVAAFEAAALSEIVRFEPDILFVQHLFGTDVTESFWRHLRSMMPRITLIYHEGDPFDRHIKRLDRSTIAALRHADLVFACGLGSLAAILQDHARCDVSYMPHCFVRSGFGKIDPAAAFKSREIVMIGNRGTRRRLRFLYVPGGRKRARLATRLTAAFGEGFALYGQGWSHLTPSACGPLPFFAQEAVIQSARITANWDHFDTVDQYFSDRLPISLAAGVPHVTTAHAGYDSFFANCPGLYPCATVSELVETCHRLLGRPDAELLDEGLAARRWVFANLEANIVFKKAMLESIAVHERRRSL